MCECGKEYSGPLKNVNKLLQLHYKKCPLKAPGQYCKIPDFNPATNAVDGYDVSRHGNPIKKHSVITDII